MANNDIGMLLPVASKRNLADELDVAELASLFVSKIGQLIGTTATCREFTCQGILYRVPAARKFMDMTAAHLCSQIALVELDLTAYRCVMTAGKAEADC